MIELFKELWYKRKARVYLAAVKKITDVRRELNERQRKFKERAEHYEKLYKEISKL